MGLSELSRLDRRMLREGYHGRAQGTVFIVKLHVGASKKGRRGVTSVNQRPMRL